MFPFLVTALITILCTIPTNAQSKERCGALRAFVEVKGKTQQTLTSAQALFPPYSYTPIAWSPLVILSSDSNDNICSANSTLSTNITNKIVLLFETTNCSAHFQVLIAQYNGARAVLMSNTDLTGTAVNIPTNDDLTEFNVHIPMRSISLLDAQVLKDQIIAGDAVQVQIGCFDASYPTAICLTEPTTRSDYRYITGNFQRQEGKLHNDHPIWTSPGWPNVREDAHIFLHDAHGKDDWYWAVTLDSSMQFKYDSLIAFRCAVGGSAVPDPTLCPKWNATSDYGQTYTYLASLNVSDGLCPLAGQKVCVDSYQHKLAGLRGTFTLSNPHEPLWFRELTQCDFKGGFIAFVASGFYGDGYFVLHEPLNGWQIAVCVIPSIESENGTFATAKWRPDLCNEWEARNDYDLRYSAKHRTYDPTFNVSIGACSAERAAVHGPPCVESDPPDVICLANNSILHSHTMGEYERLNETGDVFDSPIYQRIDYEDPLRANGSETLYIWYSNEVWAAVYDVGDYISYRQWVLTSYPLEKAIKDKKYHLYGHCIGWAYGNPMACQGWMFYADEVAHYDEQMTVTEGECTEDPFAPIPDEWPSYICIGFVNSSRPWADEWSKLHKDQLIGAFVLETSFMTANNRIPEWEKVHNDHYSKGSMWIYYWGQWAIATAKDDLMYCDAGDAESLNPMDCRIWYDDDWEVLDNIYLYECTADDVLTASPTPAPTTPPTAPPTDEPRICLHSNGNISSLLEGVYVSNGTNRDEYGTVEFISTRRHLDYSVYMWYHDGKWWLSPLDYKTKTANTDPEKALVFGYCRGGERGEYPVCEDCWYMFWNLVPMREMEHVEVIQECSFFVTDDVSYCDDARDPYTGNVSFPKSLCISKVDESVSLEGLPFASEQIKDNLGEYQYTYSPNWSGYTSDAFPDVYIAHNRMTNRWFVNFRRSHLLMCYGGDWWFIEDGWEYEYVLGECWAFDWEHGVSLPVYNLLSIGNTCHEKEERKPSEDSGKVAGTVIGIILGICACAVLIFVIYKCKNDETHQPYVGADTAETETKGGRESVELAEKPTTGGQAGWDMTKLNADENDAEEEPDAEHPLTE